MEEKRKKYFFVKLSLLLYAIAIILIELDELERKIEKRREELLKEAENDKQE